MAQTTSLINFFKTNSQAS